MDYNEEPGEGMLHSIFDSARNFKGTWIMRENSDTQ
jgi:hypothetical protein